MRQQPKLRERIEHLEEALGELKDWADGYPVKVFRPMEEADYRRCHEALLAAGYSSDRLHAAWARHILSRVKQITDAALGGDNQGS